MDDNLLIAHQILTARTPTVATEIHWGNVVHQVIRSVPIRGLPDQTTDPLRGGDIRPLGEPGGGAGDPEDLAIGRDGTIVVTLGGIGAIQFGKNKDDSWTRLAVGRRPTAVTIARDGRNAFIADTFTDAVVEVDLANRRIVATIALGKSPELSAAERGEMLFYDARLSHEGWLSCHSCHTDGHANGGSSDTLGDGGFGAPKRILSLLGVRDTAPWTWTGGSPDLAGQVRKSIETTQRGGKPTERQVEDLTAYLRTLAPPPPRSHGQDGAVKRGKALFDRLDCAHCHAPPTYTVPSTFDVGLHDEVGNIAFNPPSLRGVSQGGPYFHDGRAKSLEEVFAKYRHQGPRRLE
ncbi:MAG: cytochrome c peroxidase, partial [Candidatus Acidiferrum sp.]